MLEVAELCAFYGKSQIVDGISFHVGHGETVGLLGRNGAGKTTTLRSLIGLVQRRCTTMMFDSHDVRDWEAHRLSRLGVVLVPDYRGVLAGLTVEENLLIAERRSSPFGLSDAYGLFPRLRQRKGNAGSALSGGEQQMLAIARGLMCGPRLLLLDEPTQGLAPVIVDEIVDALRSIRDQGTGLSILIVDQNLDVCLTLAERQYIMEQGRIVYEGTSLQVANAPDIQQRFLGVNA